MRAALAFRSWGIALFIAAAAPLAAADQINVPGDVATIQEAIFAATDGDEIVVAPGTYTGTVNPFGKAITIRSIDPDDPLVVEQTVLNGAGDRVVAFFSGERLTTVLAGFTITGGAAEEGGGIGILASDPIIRNCVIRENSGDQGGGAYVYASSARFDSCTFIDNTAAKGGGVFAYAGTYVRFDSCQFLGNTATSDGGGISSTFSALRFEGCLIAGNTAGSSGGGYDSDNSSALFVNTLIRDNLANIGGAIATIDDSVSLINTTVVRNTAAANQSGAIYGIMSQPLVRNSIVRGNIPGEFDGFGLNPTAEYSNVAGGLSGPGNIDVDPLFVDPDADDFRLQEGSPSRNTGFNGWVPSYSLKDLDRLPRLLEGAVDMGGFEFQVPVEPPPPATGSLVAAVRDQGSIAFGLESPLLRYDETSDTWTAIVRNLPAYAITADAERQCFWVHSGENGMLGRVPYDTLELEEIGILKFEGSPSFGLSGMAVRDGVLYGSVWRVGLTADRLYAVDTETATLTLVGDFPPALEVWDLHYEATTDRLLVLSSPETIPPGPLGIYELDLDTFDLTEVQPFFNDDPFSQLNSLQGLATGAGKSFIFRSPYNQLEIYDAETQQLLDTVSIPDSVTSPGAGWLFGGLTWAPQPPASMDMTGDGVVDVSDLLAVLAAWGPCPDGAGAACPEDLNGDGAVNVGDLLMLLAGWS